MLENGEILDIDKATWQPFDHEFKKEKSTQMSKL